MVKDKYEVYPEIKYPMVTIEELDNNGVERFWDGDNENVSYLAYQICKHDHLRILLSSSHNTYFYMV